jgi:hypothetical protein
MIFIPPRRQQRLKQAERFDFALALLLSMQRDVIQSENLKSRTQRRCGDFDARNHEQG